MVRRKKTRNKKNFWHKTNKWNKRCKQPHFILCAPLFMHGYFFYTRSFLITFTSFLLTIHLNTVFCVFYNIVHIIKSGHRFNAWFFFYSPLDSHSFSHLTLCMCLSKYYYAVRLIWISNWVTWIHSISTFFRWLLLITTWWTFLLKLSFFLKILFKF